tara:strand:- start:206371 stop:208509 length:2139 start_codon:yes stop_codon:yes gene_type:complete
VSLEQRLKVYRLTEAEYKKICLLLGREPKGVEWAIFSALWSEHCSYKSSKVHLKKFYNKNDRVLESFGENAGVIDLGEGERVAFKMESHNHPSFISPHQGAATGVGGILRDIFTMGARPIALANYLCFGEPKVEVMPHLVDGVVRGIADYGNCVGVPMVTGHTEFNASYNGNILVNAFALGYFGPEDRVFTSGARGIGNYVVYVGAKTGRDGVHGASMASESFDEKNEGKKPTVQIGDPFMEKLLIESCLEVMKEDLVESIQDMGAAGITSSSFEMAAKGKVGLNIDLQKVPMRQSGLTPEEILLSESQERMLLMCTPEKFARLKEIFNRWDLDAEVIGEVIEGSQIKIHWGAELLTELNPVDVVDHAPEYKRQYSEYKSVNKREKIAPSKFDKFTFRAAENINLCSRDWIFNQYDQRVGASTAADCSQSVGVVELPHSGRPLGIALGCRPPMMRTDIQLGAYDAIAYPSLQLSSKGLQPLAVTDCLNFGNPEKPELMTEFVASVEALSKACEAFDTPVISGNVSLYNETLDKNVTSTPATGVVGLGHSMEKVPKDEFCVEGERAFLLRCELWSGNFYSADAYNFPVEFTGDWDKEKVTQFAKDLQEYVNEFGPSTSNVVGKMGALFELMTMSQSGFSVHLDKPLADSMCAERLYEVIVTAKSGDEFKSFWQKRNVEYFDLGKVMAEPLKVDGNLVDAHWTSEPFHKQLGLE